MLITLLATSWEFRLFENLLLGMALALLLYLFEVLCFWEVLGCSVVVFCCLEFLLPWVVCGCSRKVAPGAS